jgi:hypothetical protein
VTQGAGENAALTPVAGPQPAPVPQRRRDREVGLRRHGRQPARVAAGEDHARGRGEGQPVSRLPAEDADDGPVADRPDTSIRPNP